MKKMTALLFLIICILVITLTGCSNNDTFYEKSYLSDKAEIEKITLNVTDRELEICPSEDNKIYIDYFDSEKEYLEIIVTDNKELTINMKTNKKWTDYIGTKPSKEYRIIKIRIPDNLLATFSASTTNENINISSLSFTDCVDLKTSDGNIVCERVNVGNAINLTTKNGNITGSIIGSWDDYAISCTIKKGDCNLPLLKTDGKKSFSANCNNGDININFVK